ncbi:hypothetical protein B484DRAFT_481105 [Ochromonadaceae sp. CCMP2298]|nr:hypothetical protein B484DRAFT_481105 [Ochromonadaceae sp. CCMP2298]
MWDTWGALGVKALPAPGLRSRSGSGSSHCSNASVSTVISLCARAFVHSRAEAAREGRLAWEQLRAELDTPHSSS